MSLQLFGYKSSSVNTALLATSTQATTIITNTTEPAADGTANAVMADVLGNKADTASTTVNNTNALMRYIKGVVNSLATITTNITTLINGQSSAATSTQTGVVASGTVGSYVQLIASTTNAIKFLELTGTISGPNVTSDVRIDISTGAAASEVVRGSSNIRIIVPTVDNVHEVSFYIFVPIEIATGTRVAAKVTTSGASLSWLAGYTVGERA